MTRSADGSRVFRRVAVLVVLAGGAAAWWGAGRDAGQAGGSAVVPIEAAAVRRYPDGRPAASLRLAGVADQGVVLEHGDAPGQLDIHGARDVWVFPAGNRFVMHYDGSGPTGWLSVQAVSTDLVHWRKQGAVLQLGPPGSDDGASASYATTFFDGAGWWSFYLGTPNATPPPERVPQFPYLTLRARSDGPLGPWRKVPGAEPFTARPGTFYSVTASPGAIVGRRGTFRQFLSAASLEDGQVRRTVAIARTRDLGGAWTVDAAPALPSTEQVENSSLFFQESTRTWFLFTNHVGIDAEGREFTDAIWVYWSQDLDRWSTARRALVLDGRGAGWSPAVIGLPSVVQKDAKTLALFYDGKKAGPTESELRMHMDRDIGMATIALPIRVP